MARAVINLRKDIIPILPLLCRSIKGCSYNLDQHLAAFNHRGMPVVIHKKEIVIHMAENESTAVEFMSWLKTIMSNP